ncbi:aquaporin-like protein [Thelephora terrestris]|uniref:Aquaporin-like protein n=1 Tax=Thelephora terrestris TaxID=56493 RepID=A0A9P6HMK2_9AGAM|nr:aquaporin-like protein [Thelephora terrestris]
MALPPDSPSQQLEKRPNASKSVVQETSTIPERGQGGEGESDDARPMSSFLPQVNVTNTGLRDIMSVRVWRNHVLWRAGIIEGIASGSLNFVTGLLAATLSTWPRPAVPVGIFFGNAVIVSTLISAVGSATGAHLNPMITIATTLSGHCHPVRAIIYVFCQLVGGVIGGTILRVALGEKLAHEIHNAGCWIEPNGEVNVWQAALIEFVSVFILLFLAYGVGLDPRQAKLFGAKYGPVLVGLIVGVMTSITATIHVGYTGAAMFPGRCFGLAAGIGEFQTSHWVWWIPDILAAAIHGILYKTIPPYMKPYSSQIGSGIGDV